MKIKIYTAKTIPRDIIIQLQRRRGKKKYFKISLKITAFNKAILQMTSQ